MIHTTRVFASGNSQAVRLPKEYQFRDQEVLIQRVGSAVILLPGTDPWKSFRDSISEFSDDFMSTGRNQPPDADRDLNDLFD
jgi:antitoxin VapB